MSLDRPYILAIDDDPGRYDELRRLLEDRQGGAHVGLVVACCPACVAAHLPGAVAVLLDHDLSTDPCTCGEWADTDDSRGYLPAVAAVGVPVIVTSASKPENRAWLTTRLHAAGVTVRQHSANEIQPEWHWIGWLWTRGVL